MSRLNKYSAWFFVGHAALIAAVLLLIFSQSVSSLSSQTLDRVYQFATALIGLELLVVTALWIRAIVALFYRTWRPGAVSSALLGLGGLGLSGITYGGLVIGAAWGRPLRIRDRQIHPELRIGTEWTRGPTPNTQHLNAATRKALEVLWLHDAQKEHASIPAFSRISWMLAAVGAPAELMDWAHRAALQEIDHTRLCFSLAAGYGGQSHSVQPMPELLLSNLSDNPNPMATLARESILDGCQLEDFNADVALRCSQLCSEPATRQVLEQIAREERSHAEFSWSLTSWLLRQDPAEMGAIVQLAKLQLNSLHRPTAVSRNHQTLVDAADPVQLRLHGRIDDEEWSALWQQRLLQTHARLQALLTTVSHKQPQYSSEP